MSIELGIQQLKKINLYLETFESQNIIEYNKIRYITELLLNEDDIDILKCFRSHNFKDTFLDWYAINCKKLYHSKKFSEKWHIPPDFEWLRSNILILRKWNNCYNDFELRNEYIFIEPYHINNIIYNLKNFKAILEYILLKVL
jgi:hypothetical protein